MSGARPSVAGTLTNSVINLQTSTKISPLPVRFCRPVTQRHRLGFVNSRFWRHTNFYVCMYLCIYNIHAAPEHAIFIQKIEKKFLEQTPLPVGGETSLAPTPYSASTFSIPFKHPKYATACYYLVACLRLFSLWWS